jgi:hypothetical protein
MLQVQYILLYDSQYSTKIATFYNGTTLQPKKSNIGRWNYEVCASICVKKICKHQIYFCNYAITQI